MFRLDRSLSVNLFGPLAGLAKNSIFRVPILMYHSISNDAEEGVHPYYRVNVTPEVFTRQMDYMAEHGYRVIGLEEACGLLLSKGCAKKNRSESEGKYAVITFDDGFLDFYTGAFPVLARHDFTATVFLPSSFIGKKEAISGKKFLSWQQVNELAGAGMTFGSHTATHACLTELPRPDLELELRNSREVIEDKTGRSVRAFSYPFAFPEHNKEFVVFLRSALECCGYSCAVTTSIGAARSFAGKNGEEDTFFLRRLPVNDCDDIRLLRAKMTGGYDWMHSAQYAAKSLKGLLRVNRRGKIVKWVPPREHS